MLPMTSGNALSAWGDESIKVIPGRDPMYLLGAVIANDHRCEELRTQLQTLPRTPGPKPLHWQAEDTSRRRKVMAAIETVDVHHVVVIAAPADLQKQERARAKCLERLLFELDHRGVTQLNLEARTRSLNERDLRLVDRLRGARQIPAGIRVDLVPGSEDLMLAVPDHVLGALGMAEGGDPSWTLAFQDRLSRHDITL